MNFKKKVNPGRVLQWAQATERFKSMQAHSVVRQRGMKKAGAFVRRYRGAGRGVSADVGLGELGKRLREELALDRQARVATDASRLRA